MILKKHGQEKNKMQFKCKNKKNHLFNKGI